MILAPGTTVVKVVGAFESAAIGQARPQKLPNDSSLQLPDHSQKLSAKDAGAYRSIVGLCLYIGRERPDLMYTIKELASCMSSPTLTSLARLRKMIGYMKAVGCRIAFTASTTWSGKTERRRSLPMGVRKLL